ncbi:hypothetical protein BsWGS_24414 [Bradybaena similaris]
MQQMPKCNYRRVRLQRSLERNDAALPSRAARKNVIDREIQNINNLDLENNGCPRHLAGHTFLIVMMLMMMMMVVSGPVGSIPDRISNINRNQICRTRTNKLYFNVCKRLSKPSTVTNKQRLIFQLKTDCAPINKPLNISTS